MKAKTEKQLIRLCKRGDEQAFEELIEREREYIRGWIYSFSKGNYCLAEDIFQITIIRCWQKIKGFKGECKFSTWANHIAKNAFFDEYRRSNRRQVLSLDQEDGFHEDSKFITDHNKYETKSPSYGIEREERIKLAKSITKKVFKKLSKEHRDVLRLRDQYELEYHEISEKLKIPIGTVMSRLFYARKRANHYAIKYKKELI